jgi:hypothetical protein
MNKMQLQMLRKLERNQVSSIPAPTKKNVSLPLVYGVVNRK